MERCSNCSALVEFCECPAAPIRTVAKERAERACGVAHRIDEIEMSGCAACAWRKYHEASDRAATLAARVRELDLTASEAVEWIGAVRDMLADEGFAPGDRSVAFSHLKRLLLVRREVELVATYKQCGPDDTPAKRLESIASLVKFAVTGYDRAAATPGASDG